MPYAITLRLDATLASRVEAMCRAVAAANAPLRPAYPPHLTLALYQGDIQLDRLLSSLSDVVRNWGGVPVSLAALGVFPADGVVWAAPVVTAALLDLHARLHAALPGASSHPDYRPGAWIPHVTLWDGGEASPANALCAIMPLWTGPIAGRADRLELVRFHPVEMLWSRSLA
ncbi:MAG: 2'-5' RNA ligase family protein [Alphaproteobacteria bacterium]|nr:2'-5' RNA ligase family protein [Alphaproteobacteria bacterium]